MIIAIDGYEANSDVRVGVGRYAFELIDRIAKLQSQGASYADMVVVYIPEAPGVHMPKENARFRYRVAGPKRLWTFFGLPLALMMSSPLPDVVFSPTHYIPRWVRMPRVMAIMDVSYLSYPELFRTSDLHKLVNWTAYSAKYARNIITISEFSKRAIIEAYHVPENRVVVAYPALPDWQANRPMSTRTTSKTSAARYILAVGTLQPRKNFARLIEAFSTLADTDISLVIVGKKGWLYEDILAAPQKYGVEHRVKFMDFVPDEDLPGLYINASCFALPSLYEGFGLPVLEAMSYGVPVVVSDTSSLPEIAGDAGIYVDPMNVKSIADGLTKALSETGVAREKRISEGKKRTSMFTWDKATKEVMEVLADVGKKGAVT